MSTASTCLQQIDPFPKSAHHHELSHFSESSSKHGYKRSYSSIESISGQSSSSSAPPTSSNSPKHTMSNYGGGLPRPAVSASEYAPSPDNRRLSVDSQREHRLPSLSEALGERSYQYASPPSTANSISQSIPPPLISPTHAQITQIRSSSGDEYLPGADRSTLLHPSDSKLKSEHQGQPQLTLPSFSSLDNSHTSLPFGPPRAGLPSQLNSSFDHGSTHSTLSTTSTSSLGAPSYQHPPLTPGFGEKASLPFHPSSTGAYPSSDTEQSRQWEASKRQPPSKRRMDNFDFGSTLQNIERISSEVHHFAQRYQSLLSQARQYQTNTLPLPSFKECDEMLSRQHQLLESLTMIRDAATWQANPNDPGLAADSPRLGTLPPQDKKRRQRAAPPGRCHSCNRAETPEWRRGPDGARTLCNACGLHFAKTERKNNAKAAAAAASALKNQTNAPDSSPSASGADTPMGNGGPHQ